MIKSSKWWEKTQRMGEGPKKAGGGEGGGGRGEVLNQKKEPKKWRGKRQKKGKEARNIWENM